jgi:hypothetical protein
MISQNLPIAKKETYETYIFIHVRISIYMNFNMDSHYDFNEAGINLTANYQCKVKAYKISLTTAQFLKAWAEDRHHINSCELSNFSKVRKNTI